MSNQACELAAPPTTRRRSSRASPGPPVGKPENVRCRAILPPGGNQGSVAAANTLSGTQTGYTRLVLSSNERRLQGDHAAANSDRNGLGSILGSKFVHDTFDVHLDGVLGDSQTLPNIAIAVAFGNSSQDLDFALRER